MSDPHEVYFTDLIARTENFGHLTWLGKPIWQNLLDLWTIQETIWEIQPELLLETGTNRGGSAWYYAQLFDLIGRGRVMTCDLEAMHELEHPRIDFLIGSSLGGEAFDPMSRAAGRASGPVMVILDSDHTQAHVREELELYSQLVTPGSYILVQDGVIDTLPAFAAARPGPLPAIHEFLVEHPEYELDRERSTRFLVTHHPDGWLRRRQQD
ncbi:MAG: CmcI family methyltransferase [Solirubrobacteraceae bacterium]